MKKFIQYLIILTLLLSLVACGQGEKDTNVAPNNEVETEENTKNNVTEENKVEEPEEPVEESVEAKAEEAENKEYHVKLYYPTERYIVDGDEFEKMVLVEKDLQSPEDSIAANVLYELAKGTDQTGVENFIKEDTFHSAEVKEGIVTVDLNKEAISDGDLEEEVTLNQIIQSLLSIDGVKGVSFLVNGEEVESLHGHYDLTKVYTEGL